jgi:AcrR family transcriptional regulator
VPSTVPGSDAGVEPVKRGRKRRHDSQVERRMILDAAMVVMRRNGFAEAKISDILQEAELSNRAFYRHFSSKDELLLGMCGRDMAYVVRQLRAAIVGAPDPVSALLAYIEGYLDTFLQPPHPDRVAVFNSESARRAEGYYEETRRLDGLVAEPLLEVIREGAAIGVFRSEAPDLDGYTIHRLLQALINMPPEVRPAREKAVDHVMRYCGPALAITPIPTAIT